MTIYDISVPIRPGMAVWPGDSGPRRTLRSSIADGGGANVSLIEMSAHTGTHLDAPYHFEPNGGTVEGLSVEAMVGPCQVVEIMGEGHITAERLDDAGIRPETTRVLIKTRNTEAGLMHNDRFFVDFAAVTPDGAEWIVQRGIKLIGVDYLSVEPFQSPGAHTHHTLLRAAVIPLEGCDLTDVPPGDYTLVCAPLKLEGSDGAPAR